MRSLPDDFADELARVIDPREHEAVAGIIEAATMLDDEGLRKFLASFASRVRASRGAVSAIELRRLLQQAARGRRREP